MYFKRHKIAKTQENDEESIRLKEDPQSSNVNLNKKDEDVGIRITNLTKVIGLNKVLKNFSINLYKNNLTVLLGENGAGKTTLLSILLGSNFIIFVSTIINVVSIVGEIKFSKGEIIINGCDILKHLSKLHGTIGVCSQDNWLYDRYTVWEHLMLFALVSLLNDNKRK